MPHASPTAHPTNTGSRHPPVPGTSPSTAPSPGPAHNPGAAQGDARGSHPVPWSSRCPWCLGALAALSRMGSTPLWPRCASRASSLGAWRDLPCLSSNGSPRGLPPTVTVSSRQGSRGSWARPGCRHAAAAGTTEGSPVWDCRHFQEMQGPRRSRQPALPRGGHQVQSPALSPDAQGAHVITHNPALSRESRSWPGAGQGRASARPSQPRPARDWMLHIRCHHWWGDRLAWPWPS